MIKIHQELNKEEALSTLFHESLHAAFGVSGQSDLLKMEQEEGIVQMLESAFREVVDIKKLGIDK